MNELQDQLRAGARRARLTGLSVLVIVVAALLLALAARADGATLSSADGSTVTVVSSSPATLWVRAAASTRSGAFAGWSKLAVAYSWRAGRVAAVCRLSSSWPAWSGWRPRLVASSELAGGDRAVCGRTVEWRSPRGEKRCLDLGQRSQVARDARLWVVREWSARRGAC